MVDYSKAKVYKIINDVDDDVYIGSTCQSLSQRMSGHRRCYKHKTNKLHTKMREIGIEHFFIRLVKEFPECENVEQLRKKEGEIIVEYQPVLNFCVAGRTKKEWYRDNANWVSEKGKQRYNDKKEEIKETNKKYRDRNNEYLKEQHRQYYEENKNIINARRRERVECPHCQKELSQAFLNQHLKTQHS